MLTPPSDEASAAIARWQAALKDQQAAEAQLEAARQGVDVNAILTLQAEVQRLRTQADLLLAKAVEIMHRDMFGP